MTRNITRLGLTLAAVIAGGSSVAYAEESGTLVVVVRASGGGAVANANVIISSPTMIGGSRTVTTDAAGRARFPFLYPGVFTVQVNANEYYAATLKGLNVSIGQTTSAEVKMARITQATVEVVSSTSTMDAAATTSATHLSLDTVDSLPTARSYTDYIKLTPGVIASPDSGANPVLAGSLGRDNTGLGGAKNNTYILDGIDSTDPYTGQSSTRFNSEIIQEQEVKVGGIGADVAARGGGLVSNVVTKSGSNSWEGSLNYYFQNDGLVAKSKPGIRELQKFSTYDTAFTFGGPIVKDKIWFFTSLQKVYTETKSAFDETADPAKSTKNASTDSLLSFAKLTWAITQNDKIEASFNSDPATDKSVGSALNIPNWDSNIKRGGTRFSVKYERTWNDLVFDLKYYKSDNKTDRTPRVNDGAINLIFPDTAGYGVPTADTVPNYQKQFGGIGWYTGTKRGRDGFDGNVTYFLGGLLGDHTLKAGFSIATEFRNQQLFNGGGADYENVVYDPVALTRAMTLEDLTNDFSTGTWSDGYYNSIIADQITADPTGALATYINSLPGATLAARIDNIPISTLVDPSDPSRGYRNYRIQGLRTGEAKVERKSVDYYAQDTWTINNQFTVYLGVRFNKDSYFADTGEKLHETELNVAPRLGVTWNPGGQNTTKVYATWGRYFEPIKLDMVNFAGSFANARMEQLYVGGTYNNWVDVRQRGGKETVDAVMVPSLQSPYTDELRIGVVRSLGDNWEVEGIFTHRRDSRIVEDFDLRYINPAGMPNNTATTWNRLIPVYGGDAAYWSAYFSSFAYPLSHFGYNSLSEVPTNANYFLGNLIGGYRRYDVIDLILRKNFSNGWQMMFSHTYTSTAGNSLSSGDADFQGDTVRVDPRAPWMNGNIIGSIDHQLKGYVSYTFQNGWSKGLQLGLTGTYLSGQHYSRGVGSSGRVLQGPWSDTLGFDKTAGERIGPAWAQLDGRVKYNLTFNKKYRAEFFVDIFNITNRQGVTAIEETSNGVSGKPFGDPLTWQRGRAFYLGARVAF